MSDDVVVDAAAARQQSEASSDIYNLAQPYTI